MTKVNVKGLESFVSARTVALIGASETRTADGAYRVGTGLTRNLLKYGDRAYFVNPKYAETGLYGRKCYACFKDIPVDIDLVVYAVAAKKLEDLLETIAICHEKKVKGIVMISGGFAEASAGEEGKKRLRAMIDALGDIRLLGPNCLGFASGFGPNASFMCEAPLPGHTAFISGSGGMTIPPAARSIVENHGLSFIASYGAGIEAGLADWMAFAATDPNTHDVVIYTESIANPEAFFEAANMLREAGKPVVAMKPGRTDFAKKAVASHSGSLAGGDDVINAAFERAGIIRADTVEELYNALALFPLYEKFAELSENEEAGAFLSHAGGQGVIFADAVGMARGKLAAFSKETMEKLNAVAGTPLWSMNNPVDIVGDADIGRFDRMIRVLMDAPEVHWLFLNWDPICTVRPDRVAETVVKIREDYPDGKPIVVSVMGGDDWMQGDGLLKKARNICRETGIPHIENPDAGAVAIQMMFRLKNLRAAVEESDFEAKIFSGEKEITAKERKDKLKGLFETVRTEKRTNLDIFEVMEIFKTYGISTIGTQLVDDDFLQDMRLNPFFSNRMVVKLFSRTKEGSHKTDLNGVKLNILDRKDLLKALNEIKDSVTKKIGAEHFQGVIIQPMADMSGVEVLLGIKTDPILGKAIIFGWGGTETEIIRDSVVALPGLARSEALRLIKRTKVWKKLQGARGKKPADIEKVVSAFVAISRLAEDFPEIDELDINPLMAYEHGVLAIDGRITLHEEK